MFTVDSRLTTAFSRNNGSLKALINNRILIALNHRPPATLLTAPEYREHKT